MTDKYSRRHTRYRRVGRHRHLADGYRWSYGIELRRRGGDGTETIGQQVRCGEYGRTRVGTTRGCGSIQVFSVTSSGYR